MKKLSNFIKEGLKIGKDYKYKSNYDPDYLTEENIVLYDNVNKHKDNSDVNNIDIFKKKIEKLDDKYDAYIYSVGKSISEEIQNKYIDYAMSIDYLIDRFMEEDNDNCIISLIRGHIEIKYIGHHTVYIYALLLSRFS